ncbi:MAG: radical SAM protein [Candidatus Magasanikbacteria bacterium]|nr:radical SAM protein [Candidatus Magasanikbacteria bacterium]
MFKKYSPLPIDCVVAVTYDCNSRCVMCDIWKIRDFPVLSVAEFRKLPATLRDVNISGGEPFLRPDLPEVVRAIVETCPRARIVISTNGFMPALIEAQMKKILAIKPDIGVSISIDGMNEMHDKIRGIPDGFKKDMETLERLQKLGMTNLRLAFTILPENVSHFSLVYNEARRRGVQFTHAFAQSSEHYFGGIQVNNHPNQETLRREYEQVIGAELQSWQPKRWARAFFAYGLYRFSIERQQVLNNDPGTKFFYLDPRGVVYPSVVHNYPMGNIVNAGSWPELWYGARAEKARELVRTSGRPAWMICTSRTAIKKHPLRVGWWVLKNKFWRVKL